MHCDVAYKPRKIVIEMRVRFRLKPEAYPLGLVKQVVEEDAHWVAGNTAGALSDFRKKSPANRGVFASSRCALESGLVPDFVAAEGRLEHDPEKWVPVFRKDHAQTKR